MKMSYLVLALALLVGWRSPAAAQAKAYTMDPSHTQVSFTVDRFGFTSVLGVFAKSEGQIWIDEAHPANSRVEARVFTDSVWTSDPTRDSHVREPAWLNVAANPQMTFKSTHVETTGDKTAMVTGDLTLNGTTRPVTLTVRPNKIGPNPASPRRSAGFTITGEISRKDFGITVASALIGDKVSIHIETLAEEAAAK